MNWGHIFKGSSQRVLEQRKKASLHFDAKIETSIEEC